MCRSLGKNVFKRHLEQFIEPLYYSLRCEHIACSGAATACVQDLAKQIGPNIFNGRVEQYNPDYLDVFLDAARHGSVGGVPQQGGMLMGRGAGAVGMGAMGRGSAMAGGAVGQSTDGRRPGSGSPFGLKSP